MKRGGNGLGDAGGAKEGEIAGGREGGAGGGGAVRVNSSDEQ